MRWIESIKETIGGILQELSRAAEGRKPRTSPAHRVARGQNQLSII